MEYVGGGSLRSLVGRLALPQVLGVVEGMLAGLGHAERHGIAHRDLKPENVLVAPRGNVKIADFGIARAYDALTDRLTTTGMTIGTPAYMAPEQAVNEKLGPYTDLYSVGVIVYELLAGRPPFDADTPVGLLYCHVHKPPPPLAELMPRPQPALAEWVEWLLAKAPGDRPQSAAEAWDALEETAVAQLGPVLAALRDDHVTSTLDRTGDAVRAADHARAASCDGGRAGARRAGGAGAGAARPSPCSAAAAAGVALPIALAGGPRPRAAPAATPTPTPAKAVAPYDFDRDGRQELVVAMLRASPRGSATKSGVVLIRRPRGARPAWDVVTESSAGVPGRAERRRRLRLRPVERRHRPRRLGGPGDRHAGPRPRVRALRGQRRDRRGRNAAVPRQQRLAAIRRRRVRLRGPRPRRRPRRVRRPRSSPRPASGRASRAPAPCICASAARTGSRIGPRVLLRPDGATAGFGTRIRAGDLDNDGHVDIVEGAPTVPTAAGHLSYCRGARRGPLRCRVIAAAGGTSGPRGRRRQRRRLRRHRPGRLPTHGRPFLSPGEVRVWLGSRRGPRSDAARDHPGHDGRARGERAGRRVRGGRGLRRRRLRTASPTSSSAAVREDEGAGQITVIRGGESGSRERRATPSSTRTRRRCRGRPQPDREFGATLTVLSLSADQRPDLAVAARGEDTADERIMVVEGGHGGVRARRDAHDDAAPRRGAGPRPARRAHPAGSRRRP